VPTATKNCEQPTARPGEKTTYACHSELKEIVHGTHGAVFEEEIKCERNQYLASRGGEGKKIGCGETENPLATALGGNAGGETSKKKRLRTGHHTFRKEGGQKDGPKKTNRRGRARPWLKVRPEKSGEGCIKNRPDGIGMKSVTNAWGGEKTRGTGLKAAKPEKRERQKGAEGAAQKKKKKNGGRKRRCPLRLKKKRRMRAAILPLSPKRQTLGGDRNLTNRTKVTGEGWFAPGGLLEKYNQKKFSLTQKHRKPKSLGGQKNQGGKGHSRNGL